MALVKSLTKIRSRSSVDIIKRCFTAKSKCSSPSANPPCMDEVCPRDPRCTKEGYQQHWVECPRPIVIRPKLTMMSAPFVKRKSKPKTAVECIKIRDCDFSHPTPKQCKFVYRQECERIPPPCPAFSELLRFKPVPELTECVCQSTASLPPLRFGYQSPCFDPRENRSDPDEPALDSNGSGKDLRDPNISPHRHEYT